MRLIRNFVAWLIGLSLGVLAGLAAVVDTTWAFRLLGWSLFLGALAILALTARRRCTLPCCTDYSETSRKGRPCR